MVFIDLSMVFSNFPMVCADFSMIFIDFQLFTEFSMYMVSSIIRWFLPIFFSLTRFSMPEFLEFPRILSNMDQRKGPHFFSL